MSLICPQWLQVFAHMQKKHKIHVKKSQCACMHVCAVTWLMYEKKKHEKRHTMCMCACVCRHMIEVQVFACMKKKIHKKKDTMCMCACVPLLRRTYTKEVPYMCPV